MGRLLSSVIQTLLLIFAISCVVTINGDQSFSFNPRVPIVFKSPSFLSSYGHHSSIVSLPSATALQLSGGGVRNASLNSSSDHDSDDELLAFAEESDIIMEIRGGAINGSLQTRPQPLRISTYLKGIRQLRNSERRERRRQKRMKRLERRKLRQIEKNHQVYAKQLKV